MGGHTGIWDPVEAPARDRDFLSARSGRGAVAYGSTSPTWWGGNDYVPFRVRVPCD